MVLKKSKRGACTGNTQRNLPMKMPSSRTAAFVRKIVQPIFNDQESIKKQKGNKVYFDDGELPASESDWSATQFSLNKKKRWLIIDKAEEKIMEDYVGNNIESCERQKCKKKKKSQRKKLQNPDEDGTKEWERPARTVIVNRVIGSHSNICKAVVDTEDKARPIKKSRKWRTAVKDLVKSPENADVMYEVENGEHSQAWPYRVQSNRNREAIRSCREHKNCWNRKGYNLKQESKTNRWLCDEIRNWEDDFDHESDFFSDDVQRESIQEAFEPKRKRTLDDFRLTKKGGTQSSLKLITQKGDERELYHCNSASIQLVKFSPKNSVIYLDAETLENKECNYAKPGNFSVIKEISNGCLELPAAEISTQSSKETSQPAKKHLISCEELKIEVTSTSISASKLNATYGSGYIEGRSYPRRFGIFFDGKQQKGNKCFLIAEVMSPCSTKTTLLKIKLFGFQNVSTSKKIQQSIRKKQGVEFQDFILMLNGERCIDSGARAEECCQERNSTDLARRLSKWKTSSHERKQAFDLMFDNVLKSSTGLKADNDELGDYVFLPSLRSTCGICFDALKGTSGNDHEGDMEKLEDAEKLEGKVRNGTELKACMHSFCEECWNVYLSEKINSGTSKILCPAYKCNTVVDIVTVLAIGSKENALKYISVLFENAVHQRADWQWCPGCDKAAFCCGFKDNEPKYGLQDIPTVNCTCRKNWCFGCHEEPHWPAACKHMETFQKEIERNTGRIYDRNGDNITTSVELKKCPFCKTPINKNQGCNYMTCRCGKAFCWNCLQPFGSKTHASCKNVSVEVRIFSSLDVYENKDRNSLFRRIFRYNNAIKEVGKRRTKFGIDKRAEDFQVELSDKSKIAMLKRVFSFQKDVYKLLENIAMGKFVSKVRTGEKQSKNFNRKCVRFYDKIDFLMNQMRDILQVKAIANVKFGELNETVKQTEEALISLKTWGL